MKKSDPWAKIIDVKHGIVNIDGHQFSFEIIEQVYKKIRPALRRRRRKKIPEGRTQ